MQQQQLQMDAGPDGRVLQIQPNPVVSIMHKDADEPLKGNVQGGDGEVDTVGCSERRVQMWRNAAITSPTQDLLKISKVLQTVTVNRAAAMVVISEGRQRLHSPPPFPLAKSSTLDQVTNNVSAPRSLVAKNLDPTPPFPPQITL